MLALAPAGVRTVLLDMATRETPLLLRAAVDVGGYHMRGDSLRELIALIRAVASGASSTPPTIAAILLRQLSTLASVPSRDGREPVLTAREHQILRLLELGRSNRATAAEIGIAVPTVKNHVHSVLSKLGVGTRAEAAAAFRAMRAHRGFDR